MEELLEPTLTVDFNSTTTRKFTSSERAPSITMHQGQRKLFLTELRFLTKYYDDSRVNVVLYIGAASGQHFGLLSHLFPDVIFILYDGAPFFIKTLRDQEKPIVSKTSDVPRIIKEGIPGIYTIQSYVFLEEAKLIRDSIGDRRFLFISDIRTASPKDNLVYDDYLLGDLALQYHWVTIMDPDMCMLKFRFPFYHEGVEETVREGLTNNEYIRMALPEIDFIKDYYDRRMTYFDGEIWIQAFAGQKSSETRLITDGKSLKDLGTPDRYDSLLFRYNMDIRPRLHVNPYSDRNVGFDHCGDCSIEADSWEKYFKDRYVGTDLTGEIRRHVNMLSRASRPILQEPGGHGYLFPVHRRREQSYDRTRITTIEDIKISDVCDLRSLNNFVKSIMINRVVKPGDTIIDLGGGIGEDLNKFLHARASKVVLTDISETSIDEAMSKYKKLSERYPRIFEAEFIDADSSDPNLMELLPLSDVVSAQFNLHYVFDNLERAEITFDNIAESLKKGGRLLITIPNDEYILKMVSKSKDGRSIGNKLFNLEFDGEDRYTFYLIDSVDNVQEYLIHRDDILKITEDRDLKLTYEMPFDQIINKDLRRPERQLMEKMVPNVYKDSKFFPIPKAQWDIFKLYKVMIFEKTSDPERFQ